MLTDEQLNAALKDLAEHEFVGLSYREDAEQVWRFLPLHARPFYRVRECHILHDWVVEKAFPCTSTYERERSDPLWLRRQAD